MDNNEIIDIIIKSINRHQTLISLGWDTKTSGYRKLNEFILINNIDIAHFETRSEQMKRQNLKFSKKIPLSEILVSGSTYRNTTTLKERLYKEGIKERICEKCGQEEIWNGERMSLILDHINGIYNDNRLKNLRILCPNCNATLPTHCGKNAKQNKKRKKIRDNINISKIQRKTERPPYKQLISDVNDVGYSATGRKYGVSDNAIRKWIRFYENH